MSKKYFDDATVEKLVSEQSVQTDVLDTSSRWSNSMCSVVQEPETGKFYRIYWEQGKTEAQEDEYYANDFEEVLLVSNHINVSIANEYLTPSEIENNSKEMLENFSMLPIVIADNNELEKAKANLQAIDVLALIDNLTSLNVLDVTQQMTDEKQVVIDYLRKLSRLKKEIIKNI